MNKLKKEDLELMTYDDIAYELLNATGKKAKIQTLFKKICNLLNMSDAEFEDKIADFFELLSTDKRFIMLENGYFDLRDHHSHKIVLETDELDAILDSVEDLDYDDEEEDFEEKEEENFDADETDDVPENDLKDLVIISEDEIDPDEML